MEVIIARMTVWPHAGRSDAIEHVAARRRLLRAHPRPQTEAMALADDRILGDTNPSADFSGCDPLFPQLRQPSDALGRPGTLDWYQFRGTDLFDPFQSPGPVHFLPPYH